MEFRGYEVLGPLGRGGMGVVYRARQKSLGRPIALKVLAPKLARSEEFTRRFEREAKLLATINHPNVVRIYESGREGDFLFLAMEYVEGSTLQDRLDEKGALFRPDLLRLIVGVCEGLDRIHRAGLIHRDIKPSNILISAEGTPKILDFGLAVEAEDSTRLTETGAVLGSPHYMAPEQVLGKDVDGRADLYAVGVMLYQIVSGHLPFQGATPAAVLVMQVEESPPQLPAALPGVPSRLVKLVFDLLSKRPAHRPSSAESLRVRLVGAILELESKKPGPGTPGRRRALLMLAAAALVPGGILAWRGLRPRGAALPVTTASTWTRLFDGKTVAFMREGAHASWHVRDGALMRTPGSMEQCAQTVDDYVDGEFRILFSVEDATSLLFRVRQGEEGFYGVEYTRAQLSALSKVNELVFSCRGNRVTGTQNGVPIPLQRNGQPGMGCVQLCSGQNSRGLRILAVDYRPLPPGEAGPGEPTAAPVDLLKIIDPRRDALIDSWAFDQGVLVSPHAGRFSLLQIPFAPPEEYDIVAVVEQVGPRDPKFGSYSLDFGLVAGGRQFGMVFGSRDTGASVEGALSALNQVDGRWAGAPDALYRGAIFKPGATVELRMSVRKERLRVSADGKHLLSWNEFYRLSPHAAYRASDRSRLFLGSWIRYRISKLELRPAGVSGR